MTSPISGMVPFGVGAVGAAAGAAQALPAGAADAAQGADGFAALLAASFDQLQARQTTADGLALQAATGDLRDVHDYMIASTEAKLATEMVVTIKNQAVAAFNEIMRMPI